MRRLLLPVLLLASAALATQPTAFGQQFSHGGSVGRGPVGGLSHSEGISHHSVPSSVPGMAFGGTPVRRSETVQSWRDSGSVREHVRSERAPEDVSRGWGQTGRHFWGGHYFIWNGGGWVTYDDDPVVNGYVDSTADTVESPQDATPTAVSPDDAPAAAAPDEVQSAVSPDQADDSLPAQVQRALTKGGYDPGPINGVLDAQTRGALQSFQKDKGLEETGRIGAQTLDALGIR